LNFKFAVRRECRAATTKTKTKKHMMLAEIYGNLHVGLACAGGSIGIGIAAVGAELAIGRNPGTFGKVFTVMLIGMALAEGLAILALFLVSRPGN
jgi:F-type H+-transporting ATPase subunit c